MKNSGLLLIVEDEHTLAVQLEGVFVAAGWMCVKVPGVETAKRVLERGVFDVIISDYDLDDGLGGEIVDYLVDKADTTPVIITSGAGAERLKHVSEKPNVVSVFHKPVDQQELLKEASRVCRKRADKKVRSCAVIREEERMLLLDGLEL